MFWPENKVISLMEIAFHFGAINYELNNGKKRREAWKEFKTNCIEKRLKYVNPDRVWPSSKFRHRLLLGLCSQDR